MLNPWIIVGVMVAVGGKSVIVNTADQWKHQQKH